MTGIVDWAATRARMVVAFIVLSLLAGSLSYVNLPKEGEPDIEIPALFVSVVFPGVSAEDSEDQLVKIMETELADLDGLKTMWGTAAANYAGMGLEFEFGWDKAAIMADVRDAMTKAEAEFPDGAEPYSLEELNFSTFPMIIVTLSGDVPERTMARLARELQDDLESLDAVLEAGIAGDREEMMEVLIDPLQLEAYNVTAGELITTVRNNNVLVATGDVDSPSGSFGVKMRSSFKTTEDIYSLPIKTNGDRVITLGDLADINLTFEDIAGTARFDGEPTVALQVVKRKGYNIIDTAALIKETVAASEEEWPDGLRAAVTLDTSIDQSRVIDGMVRQLEGSVLTAIALVMIVTLAALGIRPALLVGFAIPTSFLLCFALLAIMGVAISNIVMFGLILAVGMLVDGAIVVVEYADKKIAEGEGAMRAYVSAAKRMFWPVVSSTATTLCAFLPMLFWPGVPGQFMKMLPFTLIFVLSASLLVALVYLPVMGGVTGRLERWLGDRITGLASGYWVWHLGAFVLGALALAVGGALVPALLGAVSGRFGAMDGVDILGSVIPTLITVFAMILVTIALAALALAGTITALVALMAVFKRVGLLFGGLKKRMLPERPAKVQTGHQRTLFGRFIHFIAANPIAPVLSICAVFVFVGTVAMYFANNNRGVEFFVDSEPENALAYVLGRGNLSIEQKDDLVRQVEDVVRAHPNVQSVFAFAGEGGLNNNTGGLDPPIDTIGQVQFELINWEDRPQQLETWFTIPLIDYEVQRSVTATQAEGRRTIDELTAAAALIPGVRVEVVAVDQGPAAAKPVHLRLTSNDPDALYAFTEETRAKFDETPGMIKIQDTLPLPVIDWEVDVDVAAAGRFGADTNTVGAMVQLVTRGILLSFMRVPTSEEEIEIRVRLPEKDRLLSTLDTLKVRTDMGLVPLSNFVTVMPVRGRDQIDRVNQMRYFDIKAAVASGLTRTVVADDGTQAEVTINPNERIAFLTEWLESGVLPNSVNYEWTGDAEDQEESGAFLSKAFAGALGLMFIILLAQFNSVYNAVLVLLAVILSTTGVLVGMLVMQQPFSIIMTGTGIVALAGIVVNNNIVLIDTYQEYSRYMPRIEAITRTAEARIRPVLLTTSTTMAGLAPMMCGLSLNFADGGYTVDSPTALWWKQLATAVVFGLGVATALTLVFTPSMLAMRIWATTYVLWMAKLFERMSLGRTSAAARDWALSREARASRERELIWDDEAMGGFANETGDGSPDLDDLKRVLENRDGGGPLKAAE
ncbi:MAG: efflux RND transporter permease subunit [Pseudomonadota bacterium]